MKQASKIIEFPLDTSSKINVTVTKKRMKNLRLTISKSAHVAVSIPYYTSYSSAYEFLMRKRSWIVSQLSKIKLRLSKDCCNFVNNGNIFLLGNNYWLKLEQSTKNKVDFDGGFTIYCKNLAPEYIKSIFIKWCKKYFLDFFTNRLNNTYQQTFNDNNVPIVKIKTMKSMWGNCNFVNRVISLNLYLAKAPIECIDYVITHELIHLVHHNHGKDFYAMLNNIIPDWKVRKNKLNNCSLQF